MSEPARRRTDGYTERMEGIVAADARWPDRLLELCLSVGPGPSHPTARTNGRLTPRSEAWVALRDALARFLRRQARQFPAVSTEDQEDLASAKALELLSRAESGEWRLEGRSGAELAGYLATVARNALIDHAKHAARIVSHPEVGGNADPDDEGTLRALPTMTSTDTPETAALAREFIGSLRSCVVQLQPRARCVWFLRVFYGMSTREIALHPDVVLRVGHVDVLVQRARDAIRSCMLRKGLEPADMPAGAFVELWELLESFRDEVRPAIETKVDSR